MLVQTLSPLYMYNTTTIVNLLPSSFLRCSHISRRRRAKPPLNLPLATPGLTAWKLRDAQEEIAFIEYGAD